MTDLLTSLRVQGPLDKLVPERLIDALADAASPLARRRELLLALSERPDRGDDLAAIATALRARAVPVQAPPGAIDTCGTGGDGSGSFNVSTAAALVIAACGAPVVKHGNRAVSSRSGSADFIEALGARLASTPEEAQADLARVGFAFLFAPCFHQATREIGPLRKQLGVRTAFNLLGPLTNPAAPARQLVGAATPEVGHALADALSRLPIERAIVVHGDPGWDEATPCGTFMRWDVRPGEVTLIKVDPLFTYGVARAPPEALAGGDATENTRLFNSLHAGVRGGLRDAVLLNAALGLELATEMTPAAAFARAGAALDQGAVRWLVEQLTLFER